MHEKIYKIGNNKIIFMCHKDTLMALEVGRAWVGRVEQTRGSGGHEQGLG